MKKGTFRILVWLIVTFTVILPLLSFMNLSVLILQNFQSCQVHLAFLEHLDLQ